MNPAQLLEENIRLLDTVAHRFVLHSGKPWLREDFRQAAAEGFLHAFTVRDWNPDLGTLSTFTWPWMWRMCQRVNGESGHRSHTRPDYLASMEKVAVEDVQDIAPLTDDLPVDDEIDTVLSQMMVDDFLSSVSPEDQRLIECLIECGGKMSEARVILGLSRHQIIHRINFLRNLLTSSENGVM